MIELFIIGAFLLWASYEDVRTFLIPYHLSIPFILVGLIYNTIQGHILYSLGGLIFASIIGIFFTLFKTWGGGDTMLLIGLGSWVNPDTISILGMFLFSMIFVGIFYGYAFLFIFKIKNVENPRKAPIPFAPALLISFIIAVLLMV